MFVSWILEFLSYNNRYNVFWKSFLIKTKSWVTNLWIFLVFLDHLFFFQKLKFNEYWDKIVNFCQNIALVVIFYLKIVWSSTSLNLRIFFEPKFLFFWLLAQILMKYELTFSIPKRSMFHKFSQKYRMFD